LGATNPGQWRRKSKKRTVVVVHGDFDLRGGRADEEETCSEADGVSKKQQPSLGFRHRFVKAPEPPSSVPNREAPIIASAWMIPSLFRSERLSVRRS
jgi:hypothetical protein